MGTSDWSLPRVTAIAQAGGAARCSSAVAMAADKLLSWMQGSKSTVRLFNKHLDHGFQAKKEENRPLFRGFSCRNKESGVKDRFDLPMSELQKDSTSFKGGRQHKA